MFIQCFRPLLGVAWVLAMPMAWAQASAPGAAPVRQARPSQPPPMPTPLSFKSVMSDYRPYSDQPVGAWAEANRTVEQAGGWRAYAKEASQPEGQSAPAPTAHDHGAKP